MKKYFNLKNIIFYLFVFLLSFFIIAELLPTKTTLQIFGFKGYAVASGSMEPIIMTGDYIIVTSINHETLEKDDIVSFYAYLPTVSGGRSKEIVTHYIYERVEIDGMIHYLTYSEMDVNPKDGIKDVDSWRDMDSNPTFIYPEDIIGGYQFRIPFLGFIILEANKIMSNPILLLLIIVNVTIVVVLVKYILKKPKEEIK
jgi:signal peptidase I